MTDRAALPEPRIIPASRDYPGLVGISLGGSHELVVIGDPAETLVILRDEAKKRS